MIKRERERKGVVIVRNNIQNVENNNANDSINSSTD